jgi:hypothetical protein
MQPKSVKLWLFSHPVVSNKTLLDTPNLTGNKGCIKTRGRKSAPVAKKAKEGS